jgi:hypothetical protein
MSKVGRWVTHLGDETVISVIVPNEHSERIATPPSTGSGSFEAAHKGRLGGRTKGERVRRADLRRGTKGIIGDPRERRRGNHAR